MEKKDKDSKNRTSYRLPIKVKVLYNIIYLSGELGESQNILTKNISAAGFLFESEKQFSLDTKFKIALSMPEMHSKLFDIEAAVVRIEKLMNSNYDIGVKFTVISDLQREEIKKCIDRLNITMLLEQINIKEISDLHLTVDSPPMVRRCGEVVPFNEDAFSAEEIKQMIHSILTQEQKNVLENNKDLDFLYSPHSDLRCRVSVYQQRGYTEVVFRNIIPITKTLAELGLPDIIEELCQLKDGLVIIGGTTGSGKTVTITKMIDIINRKRGGVILSLEKPIEYLHANIKGIVKQREVGVDVLTFASGLKAALRQDPDVIVVGEVVDSDTVETALQAAETGHLVITSLHATDTVQIFDRIISFFPLDQHDFIYARLSHSLKAVIIQKLLLHKNGIERVLATEVCVANTAVRRNIHNGDLTQLPSVIQTGSKYQMHLMQDSISRLFEQGLISGETYELNTIKA